jgi:hypothetical protein
VTATHAALRADIEESQRRLAAHPLFAALRDIQDLRLFMQWHVFAVWDFLSLLKRLQRDLTGTALPWTPAAHPRAARLINEIVLGEESDRGPDGEPLSHFELYRAAMVEIGADTGQIDSLVEQLRAGISLEAALARAAVAPPIAAFVRATLQTAINGELPQVLGSFFHGREAVIPAMFSGLLRQWRLNPDSAPIFVHYLRRHIALDHEEHGPMAQAIIAELVDEEQEEAMLAAALAALRQRQALWDALQERMTQGPQLQVAE